MTPFDLMLWAFALAFTIACAALVAAMLIGIRIRLHDARKRLTSHEVYTGAKHD